MGAILKSYSIEETDLTIDFMDMTFARRGILPRFNRLWFGAHGYILSYREF